MFLLNFTINNICTAQSDAKTTANVQQLAKSNTLKAFVDSGIAYVKKYGKSKAYKEFNNPKGKFVQGDMFLFVYNYQGVNLVHGDNPKLYVGTNRLNFRAPYGTPIILLLSKLAKRGGGFLHYYGPDPVTKKIEYKTAYVEPIDNDTFIGSGVFENIVVPQTKDIRIEELKSLVHEAIAYYKQNGQVKAFAEFGNPSSKFLQPTITLFVVNYAGKCLFDSDPALIGQNNYNLTDAFDTPFIQMFIETAKNGGGVVAYYWPDRVTKKNVLKVSYIEQLTENTLIGGSIEAT